MDDLLESKQCACGVELDRNLFIGFVGGESSELARLLGEDAVAVYGTDDGDFWIVAADATMRRDSRSRKGC